MSRRTGLPPSPVSQEVLVAKSSTYVVPWTLLELRELYYTLIDIEATNIVLKLWQTLPGELRGLIERRAWED